MEMCLTREPLPDMKLCGAVRSVVPWMHLLLQQCLDGTDPTMPLAPSSDTFQPIFQSQSSESVTQLSSASRTSQHPSFLFCFVLVFFRADQWHMEVPRLEVKLELQLPAYTTATPDPSCICDLHRSSQQHLIPDPRTEARDRTRILMDTRWIHF